MFFFWYLFFVALKSKIELDTLGKQTVALSFTLNVKLQRITFSMCKLCFPLRCIFEIPNFVKGPTDDGPGLPASSFHGTLTA